MFNAAILSPPPPIVSMNQYGMSSSQMERTKGRPAYSMYRLQYDLAQLADELPRGIRVVTDDADM